MITAKFLVSKNTLYLVDRCTGDYVLLMNDKVCTNCSNGLPVTTNDTAVLIRTDGSVNENLIRCPIRTVVQIEAMKTFDANKTPLQSPGGESEPNTQPVFPENWQENQFRCDPISLTESDESFG